LAKSTSRRSGVEKKKRAALTPGCRLCHRQVGEKIPTGAEDKVNEKSPFERTGKGR